jgi:hypothetical protein
VAGDDRADAPEVFGVTRASDGSFALSGIIDEVADLSFFEQLSGSARLNMRRVRRINSYGVRAWIDAVRRVPRTVAFELVECPPSVVDQINMVAGFVGRGKVVSFYAPMACERCGHEDDHLFSVADYRAAGKLPPVACPRCGATMLVDDLEEQYLLFAREGG